MEATYVLSPQLHHHWQIFVHAKFLVGIRICDNPIELGPDYVCVGDRGDGGGEREKFKFKLPDCAER